jgi:hypothetical protein
MFCCFVLELNEKQSIADVSGRPRQRAGGPLMRASQRRDIRERCRSRAGGVGDLHFEGSERFAVGGDRSDGRLGGGESLCRCRLLGRCCGHDSKG